MGVRAAATFLTVPFGSLSSMLLQWRCFEQRSRQPKCRSRKCWTTGAWPGAGAVTWVPTALREAAPVEAQEMEIQGTGPVLETSHPSYLPVTTISTVQFLASGLRSAKAKKKKRNKKKGTPPEQELRLDRMFLTPGLQHNWRPIH